MKSIMQDMENETWCYRCGSWRNLERHHVLGAAYRKKSERDGLVVYLCRSCHNEPPNGVHHNRQAMDKLRREGQLAWMEHYGKTVEDFIAEYERSYL